jgi:hypothetical protein
MRKISQIPIADIGSKPIMMMQGSLDSNILICRFLFAAERNFGRRKGAVKAHLLLTITDAYLHLQVENYL